MTTLPTAPTTVRTPAEHVADHTSLHNAFNDQRIWIPASLFRAGSTAPAEILVNDIHAWAFDATLDEEITATLGPFPDDWDTWNVRMWVSSTAGSSGDVSVTAHLNAIDFGEDVSTSSYGVGGNTIQTLTNDDLTSLLSIDGLSIPTGDMNVIRITRNGSDGLDTYANDMNFYGMFLEKAS